MEYHVSKNGNDTYDGTKEMPFFTISKAAEIAAAGDTVIVHTGIYREWVSPVNSGTADKRIIYKSAGDGEVIISGAEPVQNWCLEKENVYSAEIDNSIFTYRNPFKEELYGDWLFDGEFVPHLGDVYINGKSMYETGSLDKVYKPEPLSEAKYKADSLLVWFAEVGKKTTKIWANFGGIDPNKENIEISVRPFCFFPNEEGKNYITVSGFTMCQAATQWAPPTALQEGIIGPHWSKGWIIENNTICETKCVGISLGKELETGDNEWSHDPKKGGTQREQEVIFRALRKNWSKESIGSHVIRNNIIHDCEQAGIVGHMGGAFSIIEKNTIYNIHHKMIFHGAEVSGIKLHASLDTQITDNVIHGCYRAIWLDWQAQGTRISRNVFYDNLSEDLFVEVCHGPYTVDNNLFLSKMNFRDMAQGGAFVHNLFAGRILHQSERRRFTPYHFPHETHIAGYSNITGGDDRFYNNIFAGDGGENEIQPMTFFEHLPLDKSSDGKSRSQVMDGVPEDAICRLHPVGLGAYDDDKSQMECFFKGNAYIYGAVPSENEKDAAVYDKEDAKIAKVGAVTGEMLGKAFHAEMAYENPDGTMLTFDIDFSGNKRSGKKVLPGPFCE